MVPGDAGVLHLGVQFRGDPGCVGGVFAGDVVDRGSLADQLVELFADLSEVSVAEAGADPAGVGEVAVVVLHGQQQRTEGFGAAPFALPPTDDHDVGVVVMLDLDPVI